MTQDSHTIQIKALEGSSMIEFLNNPCIVVEEVRRSTKEKQVRNGLKKEGRNLSRSGFILDEYSHLPV